MGAGAAAFLEDLVGVALADAKRAPKLVEVLPLVDRGWLLCFRVADGLELVEIEVVHTGARPGPLRYCYRPPPESGRRTQHLARVGRLLCLALERVAIDDRALPAAPTGIEIGTASPEHMDVWLPGDCDRRCVFCSVSATEPVARRADALRSLASDAFGHRRIEIETMLRARAGRANEIIVAWSGKDCLNSPLFDELLVLAHELGYRNMSIQTPGSRLLEDGFVEFLAAHSVVGVALTAHAGDEATFDRVGGAEGAYRAFWTSFERLLADSFELYLEIPCVTTTLAGLSEHVARLASYTCALTCFHWYPDGHTAAASIELQAPYQATIMALARLRERVPPSRVSIDGVPECVVPSELRSHFSWSYGAGHMGALEFERVPGCDGCAAAARCPGIPTVYLARHRLDHRPVGD